MTAALMRQLGYELRRRAGNHEIWYHPDFEEPVVVSNSPSDWRAGRNLTAMLRRRHPDFFRRAKSSRVKRKRRAVRRQPTSLVAVPPAPEGRPLLGDKPQWWLLRCTACGRPQNFFGKRPLATCPDPDCGCKELVERKDAAA